MSNSAPPDMKPRLVRERIEGLLAADISDTDLREALEALSAARAFAGFTWLWGPPLYARNRVLFRPFVLNHFSTYLIDGRQWKAVDWKGDLGDRLERWYREADAQGDIELFQRLYAWKHRKGSRLDEGQWQADLVHRFQRASTAADRQTVLAMFDQPVPLSERAARELYRVDPLAAPPFIVRHLGSLWDQRRKLWQTLFQEAREAGDEAFAFQVYRRQIPLKDWERDCLLLASQIEDATTMCRELERRHPEGYELPLGTAIYQLICQRERDVMPYVQKHLRTIYRSWHIGRSGYAKLVRLAEEKQWWDLWSGLVRTCATPQEYNQEIQGLLAQPTADVEQIEARLLQLTGVSREWNRGPFGLAQVQQLTDETAGRLYDQYPHLLRGPFKMHISAGWLGCYDRLVEMVTAADDEPLIDFLASRLATRFESPHGWGKDQVAVAAKLSEYFEQFREDDEMFARRAAQVLGQIPAYAVWNYRQVIRTNRLARMFYERAPEKYLAFPAGIRDMLEAAEIHVQALAFRVLGLNRADARQLAADNLDLLQAALLRPLHRDTRLLALRALENAAVDATRAEQIHARCREALDLTDECDPQEAIIGLIGRLLARWPHLRGPSETPVIYGVPAS